MQGGNDGWRWRCSLLSLANSDDLFWCCGRFEGGAPSVRSGNNSRGGRVAGEPSSVDADPLSHGNFSHAFGAAWNLLHTTVVEPVWNSGFWRHIFGSDSLGFNCEQNFKRPRPSSFITDVSEPVVESHKKQCLQGFALGSQPPVKCCVKSTDDVTWQEHREAQLPEATKHWLVSFLSWYDAVEFVQCISCCDSVDARLIMLGDVFRGEAPGILTMMANSLKNFCEQLERDGLSFPCIETSLHGVLREPRRQGMLATRAKGIMETIAFVRYAMGVLECDALFRGKRCWKAATVDFSAQRNRVSPLHAKELVKLHSLLESISDVWERIFSRHSSFCGVFTYELEWCSAWSYRYLRGGLWRDTICWSCNQSSQKDAWFSTRTPVLAVGCTSCWSVTSKLGRALETGSWWVVHRLCSGPCVDASAFGGWDTR